MQRFQDVRRSTSNILTKETEWLLEEKYKGYKGPSFAKDIERLQRGEHVDYVIGFVDFLGCRIDLSKKPLIPRSETEYWVDQAIQEVQKSNNCKKNVPLVCLDMFAGSGCIGVAVLKHVPQAHVDFGEKNKRFLAQISLNAKKNGIEKKRYRVFRSDVFSGIREKYDYIFANPPYIAESKKSKVQSSVLKHEPQEALFAGKDGLNIIRKFLGRAKDFLIPGGKIYMEFDSPQKREIDKLLKKLRYQSWQFHRDQHGKWRFVVVKN